jgi:hypothetical protein
VFVIWICSCFLSSLVKWFPILRTTITPSEVDGNQRPVYTVLSVASDFGFWFCELLLRSSVLMVNNIDPWTSLLGFKFKLHKFFFLFCGTGAWTQSLHIEPLHHPYFCEGFFEIGSHWLFAQSGFKPWSSWSLPPE